MADSPLGVLACFTVLSRATVKAEAVVVVLGSSKLLGRGATQIAISSISETQVH